MATSAGPKDTIELSDKNDHHSGQEKIVMKRIAYATPLLAAGLIGGLMAFTPLADAATTTLAHGPRSTAVDPSYPISAETGAPFGDAHSGFSPLIPYGTHPQAPVKLGYINRNHDEGVTANGEVDVPF